MTAKQPEIQVNESDPTPPYEQIRRQIVWTIQNGGLVAGTKLAPVRQLAGDLRVAPGTVARAYRELEAAGYVHTKRGGGTRVAHDFPQATKSAHSLPDEPPTPSNLVATHDGLGEAPQRQRVCVNGIARTEAEVLLVHSARATLDGDAWVLPGGEVGWGLTPQDVLRTQCAMQTGLEIEVKDVLEVSSEISELTDGNLHSIELVYRIEVSGGALRSHPAASGDRPQWVPVERLVALPLDGFTRGVLAREL